MKLFLPSIALLAMPLAVAADLQTVISALRAQDYRRALALAEQISAHDVADPRVWVLQGMANEGLKKKAEALSNYRSALEIQHDYMPALKAEAQLEYADGNQQAGETLDRILKLDPADQVSHAMLAALSYKQGNCRSAVAHYRQSPDAIANKPDALTQYGGCLLNGQQPDDAIAVLTSVVAIEPNQWWPRYNLASAELFRKRPAEAIKVLEPALQSVPANSEVLDLASAAHEALNDTPRAVSLLRTAILNQPNNEKYYLHFADVCFDHQSFQVGIDMIDAGLLQLPKSANLYLARGILRTQVGDFAAAERDFDQADKLDGDESISGAAASLAELQNSNLDKALQVARAKLKSNPQDPMLHYVKAETLKQLGVGPGTTDFREAVDSASAAVRLKPDFITARNLLGSLYMQENKLQLAIDQFNAVLKQDASDQTAIYHLIQAARKAGKNDQIPHLLKQLTAAKVTQRQKDEAAGRYRLVEGEPPAAK